MLEVYTTTIVMITKKSIIKKEWTDRKICRKVPDEETKNQTKNYQNG